MRILELSPANAIFRAPFSSIRRLLFSFLLFASWAWPQDQAFRDAFARYQSGSPNEARALLLTAVRNGHPSALDYSLLGTIELQEQHFADAERYLEDALRLEPGLPGTRVTLARIKNQRGDTEGALALLLAAKKLRPDDPEILFALGAVCLQMDLVKDASTNLSRAVQLAPANRRARYALASARIADHDLPAAIQLYTGLLNEDPTDAQFNYALGATYFLSGDTANARTYLEKSISLEPGQVESYYYLALLAQQAGDHARSSELLQTVIARQPKHARAHVALAMDDRSAGRLDDAKRELEKAVEADPQSQKAHYQLGLVLTSLKEPARAKAELDLASRLRASSDGKVNWELVSGK